MQRRSGGTETAWIRQAERGAYFVRFQEGDEEENNGHHVKKFWERTEALYRMGCAILILHHTPKGKPNVFRGHTDILGKLDLAFYLKGRHNINKLTGLKLVRTKDRLGQADFAEGTEILISAEGQFTLKPKKEESTQYEKELQNLLRANPRIAKASFERLAMAKGIPQTYIRAFVVDEQLIATEVEGVRHFISLK